MDLSPVRKICIEFDLRLELHRHSREVYDIDVFMHAVSNESRNTKFDGLGADQPPWAKVGTRIRIKAGRRRNVITHQGVLMHVRERQRMWWLAIDDVYV